MKIKINRDYCIGCGLCAELVPDVFRMRGELAELIVEEIPENLSERVNFAIEDCPGKAIQIKRPLNPEMINRSGFAESLQ